jgi:effector-binding domain-containing protein
MWKVVNQANLKNKGLNIWVYDEDDILFAGVELNEIPVDDHGLEQKNIEMLKYASYKHYGPYEQTTNATRHMMDELKRIGLETGWPYIEIYGHQNADESKPETELLVSIK